MAANSTEKVTRVAFLYNIDDARYWNDGLNAALGYINSLPDWEVATRNLHGSKALEVDPGYDFYLVWGALESSQVLSCQDFPAKKGVCVAGGPIRDDIAKKYDVVFVETPWHVKQFKDVGIDTKLAFGTNTGIFKPIPSQVKVWDRIFPAAFAKWKRHHLFAKKPGKKLAAGYIQPNNHEAECYRACLEDGVMVMPRVTPDIMPWLYSASETTTITSSLWGGSERTVLESLACGVPVEIEADNPKLLELLELCKDKVWTEFDYAKALMKGIKSVNSGT